MQEIVFTVDQLNQLINALGALPFNQVQPIMAFIQQIAAPQLSTKEEVTTD